MKTLLVISFVLINATSALAIRIYTITSTISAIGCKFYNTLIVLDPDTPQDSSDDRILGLDTIMDCPGNFLVPSDLENVRFDEDGSMQVPSDVEWIPFDEYKKMREEKEKKLNAWAEQKGLIHPEKPKVKTIQLQPPGKQ